MTDKDIKCKNFNCNWLQKYSCKRYVSDSNEHYDRAIDLKDECNEDNNYAKYICWNGKDKAD